MAEVVEGKGGPSRWLLAVLAVGLVGVMATLALAASADPAPPQETGTLKVIKSVQGSPGGTTFPFSWECEDEQGTIIGSGSMTYPTDFTGANYQVAQDFPVDTECTVTETVPAGWFVSSRVEGQQQGPPPGFVVGQNPVTITIQNGGNNTVHFKNSQTGSVAVIKELRAVDPIPAASSFTFTLDVECDTALGGTVTEAVEITVGTLVEVAAGSFITDIEVLSTVDGVSLVIGDSCTFTERTTSLPEGVTVVVGSDSATAASLGEFPEDEAALIVNEYRTPASTPGSLEIDKVVTGDVPPGTPRNFVVAYDCGDIEGQVTDFPTVVQDLPAGVTCVVTEQFPDGDSASWSTSINGVCGTSTKVTIVSGTEREVVVTNTFYDAYTAGPESCGPNAGPEPT